MLSIISISLSLMIYIVATRARADGTRNGPSFYVAIRTYRRGEARTESVSLALL